METAFVAYLPIILVSLILNVCILSTLGTEYEYNRVNFIDLKNLSELKSKFFNFNGDRANTNIVLGVYQSECYNKIQSPIFKGIQRFAGGNVIFTISLPSRQFPLEIKDGECARIFWYRHNSLITEPTTDTYDFENKALLNWYRDIIRVNILMSNSFSHPLSLWYKEEGKDETLQGIMQPDEEFSMKTFVGHIFVARKVRDGMDPTIKDNIVDYMVVHEDQYKFNSLNRLLTCDSNELTSSQYNYHGTQLTQFMDGPIDCDDMTHRFIEFTHRAWLVKRIGLNYLQPKVVEPVTETGFELRQLPPATYKWLKEWYFNERNHTEITERVVGPVMNQYAAPSEVTHLVPNLKDKLSDEVRDILEGWFKGPLKLTSIYGIRKYNNNSVLRMHVDTLNTHVVSAIINVDQEVVDDWPLVILDHSGFERKVIMQPGDMLLYESARLLHGRPEPMNGYHYDNIFIHYQPVSGWNYDWF